jgi:hypothetical protein
MFTERMKEITQGDIAESNARGAADRLGATLEGAAARNAATNTTRMAGYAAADKRAQSVQSGMNERQRITNNFVQTVIEPGKNTRTGLIVGGQTAAARFSSIGATLTEAMTKSRESEMMNAGILEDPQASPELKAMARAEINGWRELITKMREALTEAGQSLQNLAPGAPAGSASRPPAVSAPRAPRSVIRGPDGRLQIQ